MLQQAQYGRLMEPGLRKTFFENYREVEEQYSKVFKVENSEKAIETDLRMGGFGLWGKKDSAGMVHYSDPTSALALQYIHEEFAEGFTVERKLVDDEMYNQIKKMAANLGVGARATIETQSAAILNNAFTANGFDGQPLISGTHKRLDGGYMSNRLGVSVSSTGSTTSGTTSSPVFGGVADGALSDRNLKAALIQARKQVNDKGILIQVKPNILVVPPELEYTARTLIGGDNLSATGNGLAIGGTVSDATTNTNVIKNRFQVVVMDYITNPTSWFVIDRNVAELNFFWRKKIEFDNERDFSTHQWKYQGYMRFSVGYSDYRGIVGSAGTGAA